MMDRLIAARLGEAYPTPQRKVPPSWRSRLLGDLLGIQAEREQGTFRASETGALQAALERQGIRNARDLANAIRSTETFDAFIGGEYK